MEVQIHIQDEAQMYSSGDVVIGKVHIYCEQSTTISKLTTTLIGESSSSLTGAPGLLFSRREEETHAFLREEYQMVPSLRTSRLREPRPIRLDVGCHSFDFRLRVPWAQNCSSCPPNTPNEDEYGYEFTGEKPTPTSMRKLPPSISDLQKGNKVAYRVDVAVTMMRNMFKSRTVKSCPITIWPIDAYSAQHNHKSSSSSSSSSSVAAVTTARATILGPSSLPLPSHHQAEDVLGLTPAEILISATFQPHFQLVKTPNTDARSPYNREVKMDLSVTKLNEHPQELYLQSFQMLLVGYTDVRAGAVTHGHMSFWTLQSLSNIGLQVFTASDASGAKRTIDSRLWDGVTLDGSVVPHFATCNLERRYELEVLMGWQCKSGEHAGRVFFVQARKPVRISSGMQRTRQSEKPSATRAEDDLTVMADYKKAYSPRDEESRRMCARLSEPPSYNEAIRTVVENGLKGFETRNAGGW
ncbi:hypothetical protein CC86DRAFT_109709 [Ophiobolus disseminans]|uniref:Arrestin-like N-terminal domain-containing protein n=1 Tax=Ophiobolus disseminans TaxID=1469910 RepID=A0A6A6ZJS7_9PLEO|nr:hypothetical protein CC86DRAFT_109709 [Ophiobolus disseminans]